ncbi:MAG: aminotransferase class III-fold pyridoxal phosphate-dependent enzyme, partial [Pseudomonadota bacterium]
MLGLVAVPPAGELIAELREAGLLTVGAAENVIRLLPPLILTEEQIDEAIGMLAKVAGSRTVDA